VEKVGRAMRKAEFRSSEESGTGIGGLTAVTISGDAKKFTSTSAVRTGGWYWESLLVFKLPSFRALKFRLNEVKIAIYQRCPFLIPSPMRSSSHDSKATPSN
jgi:hypothetical protein